jgi:ribosomal-protein-alanine N-acetyltransferase
MANIVHTPRLACEPLNEEHAQLMFPLLQDTNIYGHIPDVPPTSVEGLRERYRILARGRSKDLSELWLNWILFLKGSEVAIGYFQATIKDQDCSIGYVIGSQYWRQGYASEACKYLISELFANHGVNRLQAEISATNAASIELVKKLGLHHRYFDKSSGDEIFAANRSEWEYPSTANQRNR